VPLAACSAPYVVNLRIAMAHAPAKRLGPVSASQKPLPRSLFETMWNLCHYLPAANFRLRVEVVALRPTSDFVAWNSKTNVSNGQITIAHRCIDHGHRTICDHIECEAEALSGTRPSSGLADEAALSAVGTKSHAVPIN